MEVLLSYEQSVQKKGTQFIEKVVQRLAAHSGWNPAQQVSFQDLLVLSLFLKITKEFHSNSGRNSRSLKLST